MVDYDLKEIFNEPIFMNTIPEDIDLSEEKYEGISPYLPFIHDWKLNIVDIIYLSKPEKEKEFILKLLRKGSIEFIGRVTEIKVRSPLEFIAKLSNGVNVVFNEDTLKRNNPDINDKDLIDILSEVMKARLLYLNIIAKDKKRNKFYVKSYMDLAKVEIRTKELLEIKEKYKVNWFDLFLCAIGINPFDMNKDEYILLRKIYLPRVLSLFPIKLNDDFTKYTHTLQFTKPGTGKTTFYVKLINIMKIAIFGKFPSRTRLIMDARSGILGAIFHNDYIVIDAFDKNLEKDKFDEFISYSESGLAQGVWHIEKGSASSKSERDVIKRDVGFIFLGNVDKISHENLIDFIKDAREWLKGELAKRGLNHGSISAFVDRLAIISIIDEEFDVNKYIIDKTMSAPYFIAMINQIKQEIFKAKYNSSKLSDLKGRSRTFAIMIAKKLRGLELNTIVDDPETDLNAGIIENVAKDLVKGTFGWKHGS
ncbi:MAG: BREX system Lon protease-like protein BrxL [Candidatus Nanopusillus sp.]